MTPSGVHGRSPARPGDQARLVDRMQAVDVLGRDRTASITTPASMCRRQRQLHENAVGVGGAR